VQYNANFGALRVEASEHKLAFRFYAIDGEVIDSYEIVK
jgi:hypothetical protein